MKTLRYTLLLIFVVSLSSLANGQTGIGARGILGVDGNAYGGGELSIQKLGRSEFDLGWANDSWKLTGLKLFEFTNNPGSGIYGGIGGGLGYSDWYDEFFGNFALDLGAYILVGPIQLGLDWRPEWNVFNYWGNDVTFNVALSGRFVFGRHNRW
ncbi:MAG: hypothetical protein R2751_09175 [Bacteroidales bacterium]